MSVKLFKEYFSGRTDVYGHANQFCIKESLTDKILQEHLDGKHRIGIYPIFNKTLTNWAAIDIDKPDFNLARDFALAAKSYKLPVYIERSKSKGHHCLLPKQEIITKTGYKNIEDIKVGDYVLTHKRHFKKVTQIFKHKYTGKICDVHLNYTPEVTHLTEDHRCLTPDFKWKKIKDFNVNDKLIFPIQKSDPSWNRFNLPAFVKTTYNGYEKIYIKTLKRNKTDLTNPKLWWIVGLYLAEGSLYNKRKDRPRGTNSRAIFVINKNEKQLLAQFINYYQELYPNYKVYVDKNNKEKNVCRFTTSNRHFYELLKLFGRVKNKHLPRWVMNLNHLCRQNLVQGYFAGDGHKSKGKYSVTSVCKKLLKGFQELLLKDGYISSIQVHSPAKKQQVINGHLCNKQIAYRLTILNNAKLGYIKYIYGSPRYFCSRIKKIKSYSVKNKYVYNLEVEDDNSYVTSLGSVHNCWMFFEEPVLAVNARLIIEMILEDINLKCEVFPKQDATDKNNPFGNFIYLPLFGECAKKDRTVFLNLNGKVAIRSSDSLSKMDKISKETIDGLIEINDLKRKPITATTSVITSRKEPPCITNIKKGVKIGHRNECAFRLAIFFKEKGLGQEEINMLLLKWNEKNEPPKDKNKQQTEKELLRVVESVFKGNYKSYGCDSAIVAPYCDKENCSLIAAMDKKAQIDEGIIVLVFRDPATMVFRKKNYEYRLNNIDLNKSGSLKTSMTLLRDNSIVYKDTVYLDKASNRKRFVKASNDEDTDVDLIKIEDLARKQIEKEEKEALDKPKQLYIMTEKEKKEAMNFLETHPRLLSEIINITDRMGIIGEEAIRLMVYLCFTSRIIENPLSVTIKGESSSGKSYIPTRVLDIVPEEGCFFISRATQNAFFHLPEDGMMHKIIWISELPGSESADYSIRTAQSEGNLVIMIPQKNPHTGEIVTTTKTVKGPVGFLITTTKTTLFSENETRNFSVFTDDSPGLTKKIGTITIKKAFGDTFKIPTELTNVFKNFQRLLNPDYKVVMPFAFEVFSGFPDKPVRIRRDKEKFRVLIEIITLLHQFHRKQIKQDNGVIYLEATLADYYLAKIIAEQTLLETIYEIGPASKIIWETLLQMRDNFNESATPEGIYDEFEFSYKDIMNRLDWSYDKTKKWTITLLKAGFIDFAEGTSGGRGKTARYRIIKSKAGPLATMFLPSVKELYQKYKCDPELFYNPLNRKESIDILNED